MATLSVCEHNSVATVQSQGISTFLGNTHIVQEPPLAEQKIAIGGGSNASAAFGPKTTLVRLSTDTTCVVAWGTAPGVAPTANANINATRLVAGQTEYFGVTAGYLLAVIQSP